MSETAPYPVKMETNSNEENSNKCFANIRKCCLMFWCFEY